MRPNIRSQRDPSLNTLGKFWSEGWLAGFGLKKLIKQDYQNINQSMTTEPWKNISATACALFLTFICSALGSMNIPEYYSITDVQAGTLQVNYEPMEGYFETAYSTPFDGVPKVALAIPNIEMMNPVPQNITWKVIVYAPSNTHIKFIFKSDLYLYSFSSFKVSYMAISGSLDFLKVDYMEMREAILAQRFSGYGPRFVDQEMDFSAGITGMNDPIIVPYIAGMAISSSVSELRFAMNATLINYFKMYWHVYCYQETRITQLSAYFLIYDKILGTTSHPHLDLDYQPINITTNYKNPMYLPFFQEINLLVGITSFNFTNGFSFNINPATLDYAWVNGNFMAENATFGFLSIKKRNCLTETPFYERFSNLCYETCPLGTYAIELPIPQCANCSLVIKNCAECISNYNCTMCMHGYVVSPFTNECVCAIGYYMYEGSCLSTCPEGFWGDEISSNCVTECMDGTFLNFVTRSCSAACPTPFYADDMIRMCVLECPPDFFGDSSVGKCVSICSSGYFGDQATRKCTTQCSVGYYGFEMMHQCVTQCFGTFLSFQPTRMCIAQCPANYFADFTTSSCVALCPQDYYADLPNKKCAQLCPDSFFGDNITRTCVNECPSGSFGDAMTRICLAQCPTNLFAEMNKKLCVAICPVGYYADMINGKCVTQCPGSLFANDLILLCVPQCPMGFYGDTMTSKCVKTCPASSGTYGQNMTKMCVSSCSTGSFAQSSTRLCVASCWGETVGNPITNQCVNTCPQTPPLYANYLQSICVPQCPVMLFGLLVNRTCVMECPFGLYRQNSTHMCTENCTAEPHAFADNVTGYCAHKCSFGMWGDSNTQVCVLKCPAGYFGNDETRTCVQTCPVAFFGDLLTKTCVATCPTPYSPNDQTRLCESACPAGTWSDMTTQQCVSACPAGSYGYAQTFACVTACPSPYFGDSVASKCVEECAVGYYGFVLTKMCVVSTGCAPYFAVNNTRKCEISCPSDQWKNENVSRCDACDSSCKTCVGPSTYNCTSCKSDTFYLSTTTMQCLACAAPCSTCLSESNCSSCMDGSYLLTTNQCFACDVKCKTCTGDATNCTSCASDRFLSPINNSCTCTSGGQDSLRNCVSLCNDKGCDNCQNDKNVCSQCKQSFSLTNGTCKCPNGTYLDLSINTCSNCYSQCAACSGPNQNQCTECYSSQNRRINTATLQCDCKLSFYAPNNEAVCIKQPMSECPENFVRDPTGAYCTEICGDGKLYEFECDDGNLQNEDGCDFNCKIEANFSCLNKKSDEPTICSYRGKITLQLISAQKDIYGNIIKLEYRIIPQLKFFQLFPDFTQTLKIAEIDLKTSSQRQIPKTSAQEKSSFSIMSALYQSDSKTLKVDVAYHKTATGKTVKISYTPTQSPYSHAMDESSSEWAVKVDNGLSLIYFPESTYDQAKSFDTLAMAICVGSLCLFGLTLLFRKMIGIEMIILVQVQVLSLSILKEIYPTLGVLTKEKYVFGYNKLSQAANIQDKSAPETVGLYQAINFTSVFTQNLNVMLFIIFFIYFVALIMKLIAMRKQGEMAENIKKVALTLARQTAFGFLLFSLTNMTTSYALEAYAGKIGDFDSGYNGTIKVFCIITIIANFVVCGLYFRDHVDSYVYYAKNSSLAQAQPLFIGAKAILIALGIALYHQSGPSILYFLMVIQCAYVAFVIILRPFKRRIDLIRSVILQLSLFYILLSRSILANSVNLDQPGDWANFLDSGLSAEFAVIVISFILSVASFVFHLFMANNQVVNQAAEPQLEVGVKKIENLNESANKIIEPEESAQKVRNMDESNIQMIQIIEDVEDEMDDRIKVQQEKVFKDSAPQIIDLSEDQGQGYDSRRKLNDSISGTKTMAESFEKTFEIIEIDEQDQQVQDN